MHSNAETRIYHVGGPVRRYIGIVCGSFAGMLVAAGFASKPADQAAAWILAPFVLLVGVGVQWLVSRARLELSVERIRLRQIGYTLDAPWTNIEGLRMDKGHEGFVTKMPMNSRGAALLSSMRGAAFGMGRMAIYDETARQLLYEQRYIPIEAFAWHVRHGKMRDHLERLAPHLRMAPESPSLPRTTTPEQRRRDRFALLFILGLVALFLSAPFFVSHARRARIVPALWSLLTTGLAVQGAWSARVAFRSGPKWMGFLFLFWAVVTALWSFALWSEAIHGRSL